AYETDLLEYEDLFDGSHVVTAKTEALKDEAREMLAKLDASGGAIDNVDFMKTALVDSQRARLKEIEAGRMPVVGVNRYQTTEDSPLSGGDGAIMAADHGAESRQIAKLKAWRAQRDGNAAKAALTALLDAATSGVNIMPASIQAAKAGVTTGEWGSALREVFGEYRGPTGVAVIIQTGGEEDLEQVKSEVERVSKKLGRTLTYVVGKPGLDGHSNGSEQIAARARAAGMNVIYEGIRFTPEEIVQQAIDGKAHVIGLSILSGSHLDLVKDTVGILRDKGLKIPVVVGGIIPEADALALKQMGVRRVYTPKDYKITEITGDVVKLVEASIGEAAG
ncbi:MAG: methylmalonyl-CoA mutase family protein, partial [Alphaproteobacteria bacterium]